MSLLAVVATSKERDALLRRVAAEPVQLGPYRAARTACATVVVGGIGPAAAAAAAATGLALSSYDAVLSLGICGGFAGAAEIGDVVVATDLVIADLGADSPEGFLGAGQLDWPDELYAVDTARLSAAAARVGEVVTGPILTVSTITGTHERAGLLASRHGAVAEAMEGWGVVEAARPHGVPVLEIRTVSNLVGVRNLQAWDLPAALASLTRVGEVLLQDDWL